MPAILSFFNVADGYQPDDQLSLLETVAKQFEKCGLFDRDPDQLDATFSLCFSLMSVS
jgi:hypothetical protein